MDADGPIVIAYDGSAAARAAIRLAGRHLRPDRELIVLNVYQPIESVRFVGAAGVVLPPDADQQVRAASDALAQEGSALAREQGFEASGVVVDMADTIWGTIVQVANQHEASLILLGTHGRSGVRATLLGSVATAVMHHAGRPVAVVPAAYAEAHAAA
ncbi:MAG TPA: universal stress protein [Solirubrobacteraceae bacterium]|jgi:nucleotide-binding universal stress UspA family protein|nr:universal stress protein [Solirubrobacteraceae bacterium]